MLQSLMLHPVHTRTTYSKYIWPVKQHRAFALADPRSKVECGFPGQPSPRVFKGKPTSLPIQSRQESAKAIGNDGKIRDVARRGVDTETAFPVSYPRQGRKQKSKKEKKERSRRCGPREAAAEIPRRSALVCTQGARFRRRAKRDARNPERVCPWDWDAARNIVQSRSPQSTTVGLLGTVYKPTSPNRNGPGDFQVLRWWTRAARRTPL